MHSSNYTPIKCKFLWMFNNLLVIEANYKSVRYRIVSEISNFIAHCRNLIFFFPESKGKGINVSG